jgi:dienelactone hydrolase
MCPESIGQFIKPSSIGWARDGAIHHNPLDSTPVGENGKGAQPAEVSRVLIDHIPLALVRPTEQRVEAAPLALWLPPLTRTKEDMVPFLKECAAAGFVAVSIDPWQHGERGSESREALAARVFGSFRRQLWPILGQTTLDCLRVIDWAMGELGVGPLVVAGGVSMGGDVAVALAGIDKRVARVAAVVATPDWTRPGMRDLDDPSRLLPQGEADSYAQWFYDHLDPFTHLGAFARGPAITFECGGDDTHVPPDGAIRFRSAFVTAYPNLADRIRVTLHPGIGHLDGAQSPTLSRACLEWLIEPIKA